MLGIAASSAGRKRRGIAPPTRLRALYPYMIDLMLFSSGAKQPRRTEFRNNSDTNLGITVLPTDADNSGIRGRREHE